MDIKRVATIAGLVLAVAIAAVLAFVSYRDDASISKRDGEAAAEQETVAPDPARSFTLTGPGLDEPLEIRSPWIREMTLQSARSRNGLADSHWADELGLRDTLRLSEGDVRIRVHVYPYAENRHGLRRSFVYLPPGQTWPDGSEVAHGWTGWGDGDRLLRILVKEGLPPEPPD